MLLVLETLTPTERAGFVLRDVFDVGFASGDLQSLMDVLAPDVVLLTDGGGFRTAALRPIQGREDGLVTGLYLVRNPEKLGRIDGTVQLTR